MRPEEEAEGKQKLLETRTFSRISEATEYLDLWKRVFPGGKLRGVSAAQATQLIENKNQALKFKEPKTAETTILAALKEGARPMSLAEICDTQTKYGVLTIRQLLSIMHTAKKIVRTSRGMYALPEFVDAAQVATKRRIRNMDEAVLAFFECHEEGTLAQIVAWAVEVHSVPVDMAKLYAALDIWVDTGSIFAYPPSLEKPKHWRRAAGMFQQV